MSKSTHTALTSIACVAALLYFLSYATLRWTGEFERAGVTEIGILGEPSVSYNVVYSGSFEEDSLAEEFFLPLLWSEARFLDVVDPL